jgi:opacity protein-like surface antigen
MISLTREKFKYTVTLYFTDIKGVNMSKTYARIAAAVTLALSSSVALAAVGAHQEFQKGFYVGVNTGASFVTGQTYNKLGDRHRVKDHHDDQARGDHGNFEGENLIFRDEASARGFNGGLTLGWNFYCDCEYIYSVELSGNLYSNRAYQNIWLEDRNFQGPRQEDEHRFERNINIEESWDMSYSGELVFKPGFFICDATQIYAILGGSVAQVKDRVTLLSDNDRRHHRDGEENHKKKRGDSNSHEDSETVYGFVLGAGVQKQLCNRLSFYSSYEYTYYGRTALDSSRADNNRHHDWDVRGDDDEDCVRRNLLSDRKLRLDTNIFKVGLLYTF